MLTGIPAAGAALEQLFPWQGQMKYCVLPSASQQNSHPTPPGRFFYNKCLIHYPLRTFRLFFFKWKHLKPSHYIKINTGSKLFFKKKRWSSWVEYTLLKFRDCSQPSIVLILKQNCVFFFELLSWTRSADRWIEVSPWLWHPENSGCQSFTPTQSKMKGRPKKSKGGLLFIHQCK